MPAAATASTTTTAAAVHQTRPPRPAGDGGCPAAAAPDDAPAALARAAAAEARRAPSASSPAGGSPGPSSSLSTWRACGRAAGAVLRQSVTSRRSRGGSDARPAAMPAPAARAAPAAPAAPPPSPAAAVPGAAASGGLPSGGCPAAAKPTVRAQASRSADGVAGPYGGVTPNAITRGPSGPMTRCSGPKLPCTRPAWWIAASPVTAPIATSSRSAAPSGPAAVTISVSEGPATYSLTRNGWPPSSPASRMRAAQNGATRLAPAASSANRSMAALPAASSLPIGSTVTSPPPGERAR